MAQWFKALTTPPEVMSSIPSNHRVAHNHLGSDALFWCVYSVHHMYKINTFLKKLKIILKRLCLIAKVLKSAYTHLVFGIETSLFFIFHLFVSIAWEMDVPFRHKSCPILRLLSSFSLPFLLLTN